LQNSGEIRRGNADVYLAQLDFCGFILRDAAKTPLLRMRSGRPILMVRGRGSAVSNHEATECKMIPAN
jgi:hypothetical protein